MAQDFYAAFGVGEDAEHIGTVDADGVALAAIQGLFQVAHEKDEVIAALKAETAALRESLDEMRQDVAILKVEVARTSARPAESNGWPGGWGAWGLLVVGPLALWQGRRRRML
ncbi:MAG: hypothetical protein HY675_15375 [Chloroflexi bacterium]|nr:hypothetical protein [Chloroflexota bacterium]